MPDKRVINRIQCADAQAIELLLEANKQASQVLRDCARPDTFLGRKTHEPFPQGEDRAGSPDLAARFSSMTSDKSCPIENYVGWSRGPRR
jgi:hypothetical protein